MGSETIGQAFDPASFEHVPVLLNECLDGLAIDPAGIGTPLPPTACILFRSPRNAAVRCVLMSVHRECGALPGKRNREVVPDRKACRSSLRAATAPR